MSGRLDGKRALITGGASGIGAATARAFVREGARVLIADVQDDRGEALAGELGAATHYRRLDVSDEGDWEAAIAACAEAFGGLDILVNNAGVVTEPLPLEETSLEYWRSITAVNIDGVFLGHKHGIRAMKEKGGAIVNLSSILAMVGSPLTGAYGPSKGAVRALTKTAALECQTLGYPIRVNSVHPGYVETPMTGQIPDKQAFYKHTPMKRWAEPMEIANAILFLASDEASFATGAELAVDGGYLAR